MNTSVHGDVAIIWVGNVCLSTLQGSFNEEGIANWFMLLQQEWLRQGKPAGWAHVLDMLGSQGRTSETTPLLRNAVTWSHHHGLLCSMLIMEQGAASIFVKMNQATNPVIPADQDVCFCQSYEEAVSQLQRRHFAITLQQLRPLDTQPGLERRVRL